MLNKIIQFSLSNKLLIGLLVLILIGLGSYQLTRLPIDAVPDITNNQVQVITVAPSYGASDIERLVTFPIEQANSNIPGLIEIRSFSRFGLSLVTIVFDDNTDVYWARQQVAERLQNVRQLIPQEVGSPELGPVTTGLGEIYQYILKPDKGYENKFSATELRSIQDWIVRRELLSVRGVAEVSSFGGRLKQYEVAINPQRLKANNTTLEEVFNALASNNENTGGAYIERGPGVLNIRTEGLLHGEEDIRKVVVKTTSAGVPLLVGDIATVQLGEATRFGALTYNGENEAAGAIVMMLKGANSSDVIKAVKAKIEIIQNALPKGLHIEPFLDRTKMVNNAISTVEKNLMEGALIVVFVLVLFLGNIRAGLLVASIIPLAMLFAVIMMNAFGVSGNLMSLGALDFGLIVDGAVIVVEAVVHKIVVGRQSNPSKLPAKDMDALVGQSAGRMMSSAVFGQLIILVVYLPIFSLQGIEGKMFKPMAQTVAFALVGAFILSLTYVPVVSALWLNSKKAKQLAFSERLMEKLSQRFKCLLEKALGIPRILLATVVSVFGLAIIVLSTLGGEFIPTLEEGDFAVETRLLSGSNLTTTVKEVQKAEKILIERFPEVEKVVSKIGSGEVPTDPMPMEAADMMVVLKDRSTWTSASTFNELAEKMKTAIEEVPGLTFSFQYPVQMRFNELMTGAKQDVVIKIFGENLDTLAHYAQKIGGLVKKIEGAEDLYVETVTGMPQIVIDYKRSVLAQYGVSVAEINRVVNAAFAGHSAGTVFEEERRFDLVLRLQGNKRKDLEDVQNLLIPVPGGMQLPLSHFASVEIVIGPNQIQREEAKRRIIVGFNAKGRDVQSIVDELQEKVKNSIALPVGYTITYGGTFENLQAAKDRLLVAVPVSLVLIFFLLYFTFKSVRQGLLIYSAIPLSAIGGIFALWSRDLPFSISAGIGFIALFGVAVLNGIVLVAEFNRLRSEGLSDLRSIVIKGTVARLRPVLMTAAVASLGFLPMALSHGAGAEVQRPLATVVIGGLLLATALTLFVLPILYLIFESNAEKKMRKNAVVACLLFFLGSTSLQAQEPISLATAIDSLVKNNTELRIAELNRQRAQQSTKLAYEFSKTAVAVEYGQINSVYFDNRISVAQGISFPSVYAKQRSLLNSLANESAVKTQLRLAELKRELRLVYYEIQVNYKRLAVLKQADSLFSELLVRMNKRLSAGESAVTEALSAEAEMLQIKTQMQALQLEQQNLIRHFNFLLNTKLTLQPEDFNSVALELNVVSDTSAIRNHPSLQFSKLQLQSAVISKKLERSKLMPDVQFSYNNMSMRGTGADNVLYTGSKRFQSMQLGIAVPIFYGAQRAKIKMMSTEVLMQQLQSELQNKQLYNQLLTAAQAAEISYANLQLHQNKALPSAEALRKSAQKQLNEGQIDFISFVLLFNQAATIENNYLNALNEYFKAITTTNYLLSK